MQELVTPAQADAIVTYAAAALGGAGVLVLAGAFLLRRRRPAAAGGLVAGAGALVYILWMVYNLIVAHFGLDSVPGLLINLGLFAVVGLAFGAGAAAAWNWAASRPAPQRTARRATPVEVEDD